MSTNPARGKPQRHQLEFIASYLNSMNEDKKARDHCAQISAEANSFGTTNTLQQFSGNSFNGEDSILSSYDENVYNAKKTYTSNETKFVLQKLKEQNR